MDKNILLEKINNLVIKELRSKIENANFKAQISKIDDEIEIIYKFKNYELPYSKEQSFSVYKICAEILSEEEFEEVNILSDYLDEICEDNFKIEEKSKIEQGKYNEYNRSEKMVWAA